MAMESSPISPGMGDDMAAVLSRLGAIEMMLSRFELLRVGVPVLGESVQSLQVMAMREGGVAGLGENLNLEVWERALLPDGTVSGVAYGDAIHYWRNGVYVGTNLPSDVEESPEGLITQRVTKLVGDSD